MEISTKQCYRCLLLVSFLILCWCNVISSSSSSSSSPTKRFHFNVSSIYFLGRSLNHVRVCLVIFDIVGNHAADAYIYYSHTHTHTYMWMVLLYAGGVEAGDKAVPHEAIADGERGVPGPDDCLERRRQCRDQGHEPRREEHNDTLVSTHAFSDSCIVMVSGSYHSLDVSLVLLVALPLCFSDHSPYPTHY